MFQSVKLALRRQKKLVLIFLLTIFLPSVTLSIFGLIALRNERYRLEKQFQEEQLDSINFIKSKVNQAISELEQELQYLVRMPSFINEDYPEINKLIEAHLEKNKLSEQFFVIYSGKQPWFPPLRGEGSGYIPVPQPEFTRLQQIKLEQAEKYEFSQKNYQRAILLLEELLKTTEDQHLKGQLLNSIARNHMKQHNFNEAIALYTEIIREFPDTKTSSGTLLPVTVRFQLVECYLESGLQEEALNELLRATKEIISNFHHLSENQFSAYVSLAREELSRIRNEYPEGFSSDTVFVSEFENLDSLYQEKINTWQVISSMKDECVDEISLDIIPEADYLENAHRYSKKIGSEDYLIISSIIPGINSSLAQGIAGIKISNTVLKDSLLTDIIKNYKSLGNLSLIVTDLSGTEVIGNQPISGETSGIISFFDDNFPPWRMEAGNNQSRPLLLSGILRSYYFWTILAMMTILGFGIIAIGRIINHEKEVLKLKSDFVSSVSHEFKTPITSIKALSERLLEGSVKDQKRMLEYYKVISQDAESLSHLVGNILDFSKMEEGKKEYLFEETKLKEWLDDTLKLFFNRVPERNYKFQTSMDEPSVPVSIDRNAMKLAINNLLDNAVKFSSSPTEIKVSLEKQQRHYHLNILDEGIGIPANEQLKIFDKFYHGKYAANHASTGTGLGLAIVKQIVEAHGGEVRVESEPGSGSTFIVLLPIETQSEA